MNNFIEINELGKGKFGTVKAMLDPKSGEKFAIKCIRIDPGNPDDRNTITSTREIEALKTIKHDNVVEFVDSWIEDDSSAQKKSKILCIRMELCGSIDLYDWLDQINQRKYSDVLEWFQQVLNAMNYVHSNGWFHRDIKLKQLLVLTSSTDARKIVEILLRHGADPNTQDVEKSTPLHALARLCLCECTNSSRFCDYRRPVDKIVQMLVDHGAIMETRNRDGNSPLDLAVSRFDVQLVKSLLEHGASLDSLNEDKMFSAEFTSIELKNYPLTLNIIEMVQLLKSAEYQMSLHTRFKMIKCFEAVRGDDTDHLMPEYTKPEYIGTIRPMRSNGVRTEPETQMKIVCRVARIPYIGAAATAARASYISFSVCNRVRVYAAVSKCLHSFFLSTLAEQQSRPRRVYSKVRKDRRSFGSFLFTKN
ncbi:unnamed protein product [Trichogramma brassicae]|uniref:Protein kinase domain-containing protein n=1 Tax=Trichogramma brassicae TaxID=86971 RepID=A0A6H5IDZ8_9HYME|nr:unnamed protein product [Trichogramma brassicae]